MLDHNAQMWENEGHFFDTSAASSSLDGSPQQLISSFNTSKNISNHSNRSSVSFISSSPINDHQMISEKQRRESSANIPNTDAFGINLLEPQTQTTIPLSLYNKDIDTLDTTLIVSPPSSLPNSRRSSAHFSLNKSEEEDSRRSSAHFSLNKSEEEEEEEGEEEGEEEEERYYYEDTPTSNAVTFITEPQFHLTYKPQISRKRRRGNLPKQVTEFLRRWLILHKKHPYPTEREKQKLADDTGLMVSQISNWFINARRRILQPLLESETRKSAEMSAPRRPTGVNVVGRGGGTHSMNNIISTAKSNNYQPHHHHNYNSSSGASHLLLQQPTMDEEEEGGSRIFLCSFNK
ncbi:homeobox KN domain-containing protein [Helicostylum pulchrum]|nr:homeobox KN domain-containing protein [Helicostylum pulchrum]